MNKLNLIIGILIGFTFLSCSSNNDNDSNLDPLIGIWKPVKEVETFIDNSTNEYNFSSCHQMSRYTFNENGKLNIVEFAEDEISGDCEERTNPVLTSGNWGKNSNGRYRLITTYTNNQQSYTDNDIPTVFEFTNNNNTLKIGYADDEIINGRQLKNYYTEFLRIE